MLGAIAGSPTNESAVVSPQAISKIICFALTGALLVSEPLKAQSAPRSAPEPEWSAVDIEGVRHRPSDYGDKRAPWLADRVKFVQPNYPAEARTRYIHGTGLFRSTLDVNTGVCKQRRRGEIDGVYSAR
jgi:hypothetical protein